MVLTEGTQRAQHGDTEHPFRAGLMVFRPPAGPSVEATWRG